MEAKIPSFFRRLAGPSVGAAEADCTDSSISLGIIHKRVEN